MSFKFKCLEEENLNDSWVDLNMSGELSRGSDGSQKRSTPISSLLSSGKLEKLLWEAQRESCHSSLVGSGVSSHRESPKSPCSPVAEETNLDRISPSQHGNLQRRQGSTDWIWDWSSRPDQRPPKDWKLNHPTKSSLSLRNSKVVKSGFFSTEMLTIIIVSNILSVMIGAGIGLYVSKRLGPEIFHWSKH